MSDRKPHKPRIRLHEYFLYAIATIITLILGVPVIIMKFFSFLIGSLGAPLKSVKNFFGFLLILLIAGGGLLAFEIFVPYDIGPEIKSVMVAEDESFTRVMTDLQDENIIKGRYLFKILSIVTKTDKMMAPGRYDFSGKISLYGIMQKFRRHDIATAMITIPEGLNIFKTAGIISRNLGVDSAVIVARALDTNYTQSRFGVDGLEGYIFPETYRIWYGIQIDEILKMFVDEFNRKTTDLFDNLPENINSKNDVMALASIIEAEAMYDDEKPVISSVYHNRLKNKMLLQADPTVIYALGGLDRPLYYRDLKFDSPYNTYMYRGLPPGPINSPGLASIKAALNPDDTEFLYFVADLNGRHIFSSTLQEHNRAKNRIKREKKENGAG
ncbi:MAG: endolytic transglycosylase MltG [Candidatus Zixiibacteriota bacterium]